MCPRALLTGLGQSAARIRCSAHVAAKAPPSAPSLSKTTKSRPTIQSCNGREFKGDYDILQVLPETATQNADRKRLPDLPNSAGVGYAQYKGRQSPIITSSSGPPELTAPPADALKPPKSNSLHLRRWRRHPRPSILQRLPLLLRLLRPDHRPFLHISDRADIHGLWITRARHEPVFQGSARLLDEWAIWRAARVYPDMDALLRFSESVGLRGGLWKRESRWHFSGVTVLDGGISLYKIQ
jgi:hypothetical protein